MLPELGLSERVAVVTGGGRGIGREIALSFAEAGADVVVAARSEAEIDLAGPDAKRRRGDIYGVPTNTLAASGPSVVSINGVVTSVAVTEFMLGVTGVRAPNLLLTYWGRTGKVTARTNPSVPDCYYCKGLRGTRDKADVHRYVRDGVGEFLR